MVLDLHKKVEDDRHMSRAENVRVIGVFRSGTNLLKYMLEQYLEVNVTFSDRWWKHQVIPTELGRTSFGPTLVVIKDPYYQLYSWFQYAKNNNKSFLGAKVFRKFMRNPIRISINVARFPTYYFRTPLEYYNQFYYAAIDLQGKADDFHIIRYDDIVNKPEYVLRGLAQMFALRPKPITNIELPLQKLRNLRGSEQVSEDALQARDFDIDFVKQKGYMSVFNPADVEYVKRAVLRRIFIMASGDESPGMNAVTPTL